MAASITPVQPQFKADRSPAVGVVLMIFAFFAGLSFILLNSDVPTDFPYLFLLPWIFALAVVLLVPSAVLYWQGKFSLVNPIVFATLSYFFPAFVIGGISLSAGWSQPYFLSFIQDATYTLPYTVVLVMLGFGGLAAGYFLPIGTRLGAMIERRLSNTEFQLSSYVLPAFALFSLGFLSTIIAFVLGVVGYQRLEEINSYDGIVFLVTVFWGQASFVLLFVVFKRGRLDFLALIVIVPFLLTSVGRSIYAGSRSGLVHIFIMVLFAYILSGRELKFRQGVLATAVFAVCLGAGFIYGTTFRTVKGTSEQQDMGTYTQNIVDTFENVGQTDSLTTMEFGLHNVAERLDIVSSLAVVVSNYEQLAPYEESFGLDNNIWKDTVTFLIPRIIWNEKPVASDPLKYSDLYFDYGDNAFAITPMGDLLRNFGVAGVPIGMLILGILLRTTYRTLVEDQPRILWRVTIYYMLVVSVSYEGFYGTIIPFVFKIGVVGVLGVLFLNFVARRSTSGSSPARGDEAIRA